MNKLVRDKIPNIIPIDALSYLRFIPLNDREYADELKKKLVEEVEEYLKAENIEELADIYEVLEAIIKLKKFDPKEINQVKKEKKEQRGGFEKRLFMERIGK